MAVFHKKIVVPDVRLCLHSAVNRYQSGKNVVVTNHNNVACFVPIAFMFRRRAYYAIRPNVIVSAQNNIWVNNGGWMNVICVQFYFDFFALAFFGCGISISTMTAPGIAFMSSGNTNGFGLAFSLS